MTNVSVTYQQIHKTTSVLLSQGVFTKLCWFSKPVTWCIKREEKIEEKILMVTEEMSMQPFDQNEVAKGHIYAVGGYNGSYLSSVERYDPSKNKWEAVADMNIKKGYMGVAVVKGQLCAMGGYNGNRLSSVERYDLAQNKWTAIQSMPTNRHSCAATTFNDQLYVLGGLVDGKIVSSVQRYDPDKNTWTTIKIDEFQAQIFGCGDSSRKTVCRRWVW
eukprot:TRINITY_DN1068_c0_g1_i1.p1 TRINITY_DN1068_c0_g1~~TRINITY_DN1068_c0_g1_i1.p1  ORF type:complete len:217 (-),score=38.45 TRINITY_DN1068_c0_g1_i1:139-789(-)